MKEELEEVLAWNKVLKMMLRNLKIYNILWLWLIVIPLCVLVITMIGTILFDDFRIFINGLFIMAHERTT